MCVHKKVIETREMERGEERERDQTEYEYDRELKRLKGGWRDMKTEEREGGNTGEERERERGRRRDSDAPRESENIWEKERKKDENMGGNGEVQ